MDIAYSWLIAVIIILLLSFTQFGIIRQVYSWFSDIIHLHSLPSPPGRWFFGHALEVWLTYSSCVRVLLK